MKQLSDDLKGRLDKWLSELAENDKVQVEVLDAYFLYRENASGNDLFLGKLVEEPKSTEEIMDELTPMMTLTKELVARYMRLHGFGIKTLGDGSVKWDIWRYIEGSTMQ